MKNMTNALNKKISENISEERRCKKQVDLKNPKNIFSTDNAHHQR